MSVLALVPALLLAGTQGAATPEAARLEGDRLVLTTGRVTREFRWNGGHVAATLLRDEDAKREWRLAGDAPELVLPGVEAERGEGGRLTVARVAEDGIEPEHLLATITTRVGPVSVARVCKLFRRSPAIGCTVTLAGAPAAAFARGQASGTGMIEDDAGGARGDAFVTDRLALPGRHWRADAVRFFTATDHNDTLVERASILLYREDKGAVGNVLFLRETRQPGGVFVVKHAPAASDQLGWSGRDFLMRTGDVRVAGSGFAASDAMAGSVEAYGVAVGVADADETAMRLALRDHMATVRRYIPARDSMLMSNTWGDRSRDSRMTEAFLLAEIDAAATLGLTHVQLDDGWQAGLSRNSANRSGQRWEDWSAEDWRPHPARFPRGLEPLVARAKARGVRLGLWFNPSQVGDYAAWARDADILIGYWRDHGIASVKIDGVNVPSYAARRNLEAMFERIRRATGGQLVINMDVTAGRRPGYFDTTRYGNIFLENRYTDWANYYPHRSLRNLWMLAAYVPPQGLQLEFLNVARNPAQYAKGDPLAPVAVGQRASFAATWAAQPLAWMELTGLSSRAAEELRDAIGTYREIKDRLHRDAILPVGAEPSGAAWTGFQSVSSDRCSGYLIIYRQPLAVLEGTIKLLEVGGAVRLAAVNEVSRNARISTAAGGIARISNIKSSLPGIWHWSKLSGQCNKSDMANR